MMLMGNFLRSQEMVGLWTEGIGVTTREEEVVIGTRRFPRPVTGTPSREADRGHGKRRRRRRRDDRRGWQKERGPPFSISYGPILQANGVASRSSFHSAELSGTYIGGILRAVLGVKEERRTCWKQRLCEQQ